MGQIGTIVPAVPVLTKTRTVTVKIVVNRRNELLSWNQLHRLVNILYFLGIYRLFTLEGFTGRKSGPEQTRILPGYTLIITCIYIYIYILLTTESICRILMLLSIRVEAEFAEERTEDHGTTSSQSRRSDRGGFPYDILWYICMITLARVWRRLRVLYLVWIVCLCVIG